MFTGVWCAGVKIRVHTRYTRIKYVAVRVITIQRKGGVTHGLNEFALFIRFLQTCCEKLLCLFGAMGEASRGVPVE